MKVMRILTPLAIAVSALAGAQQALAGPSGYQPPMAPAAAPVVYGAGTAVVRIGASWVDPDDDSGNFNFDDNFFVDFDDGFFVPNNRLRYDIDDDTTWNFSAGFMPVDHFMVELGYIGETDHEVDLRVPELVEVIDDGEVIIVDVDERKARLGDLSRWSGYAMLNWFPVCPESWVQPYVGIGVQYTDFDNQSIRAGVGDFLIDFAGAVDPIDGRLFVEDDWGWTAQIGIDIMFGRDSNWLVNAAVMYLDTDVDADLHYRVNTDDFFFDSIVRAVRTDFNLDPWVYNLGIGYKF